MEVIVGAFVLVLSILATLAAIIWDIERQIRATLEHTLNELSKCRTRIDELEYRITVPLEARRSWFIETCPEIDDDWLIKTFFVHDDGYVREELLPGIRTRVKVDTYQYANYAKVLGEPFVTQADASGLAKLVIDKSKSGWQRFYPEVGTKPTHEQASEIWEDNDRRIRRIIKHLYKSR